MNKFQVNYTFLSGSRETSSAVPDTPKDASQLREFTDKESNFTSMIQQSVDAKDTHRGAMHQLISLTIKVSLKFPLADYSLVNELSSLIFF